MGWRGIGAVSFVCIATASANACTTHDDCASLATCALDEPSGAASDGGGDGGASGDIGVSVEKPFAATSFEDANCGMAFSTSATTSRVTDSAHDGQAACEFCATTTGTVFVHGLGVDSAAVAGDVYNASIWVRSRTTAAGSVGLALDIFDNTSGHFGGEAMSSVESIKPDWFRLTVRLKVPTSVEGLAGISALVAFYGVDPGTCVLIDDFSVVKQ